MQFNMLSKMLQFNSRNFGKKFKKWLSFKLIWELLNKSGRYKLKLINLDLIFGFS